MLYFGLIFFLLSFCITFFRIDTATFDQSRLDRNAKIVGYGYKTANLMELKRLISTVSLGENYNVDVPDFVGITSNQVIDFFKKNGLDIEKRWSDVIPSVDLENPITFLRLDENRTSFIEKSKKLAEEIEALEITHQLDLNEINKFLRAAKNTSMILRTSKTDVTDFQRGHWSLMVRSTGKEDTKDLPNAGGNYSEPNVKPNIDDVTDAIKKVVASYFKPKSLNQRIDAGDVDIFENPLIPVLLQRMIGEKIGGIEVSEDNIEEIPIGCVVYTGEVEGQTPGVITIQGAFGHNEGVVNSEVAVDTFYIKDDEVNLISQIKNHRIIPVETNDGFGLELISNPDFLKRRKIFINETALKIARLARIIHEYYADPQDIELVYEPSTKTIYLVQARPLQNIKSVVASYVTNLDKIADDVVLNCSVVSAGGGAIRFIRNQKQIIVSLTLEDALNTYLYGGVDKDQVLAVVCQGNAEPTSHAAAIFRGAGKAILTCEEIEKFENWIEQEALDLLIDVQREIIINILELSNFRNKNLSDLIDNGLVKTGWFQHPVSQRLTISGPAFFGPLLEADKEFKGKKYSELLEIMKEDSEQRSEKALTTLMWKLNDELYKRAKTKLDEGKIRKKQQVYNVATRLAQKMLVDNIFKMESRSIARLYPINFLSAILFQTDQTNRYVDVFSRSSIIQHYNEINKFLTKLSKDNLLAKNEINRIIEDEELLSIMMNGVKVAFTSSLGKKWIAFVKDIFMPQKNSLIEKLKDVYGTVMDLDVFPVWINTIFSTAKKRFSSELILKKLHDELVQSEQFLKLVLDAKNWLDNFSPNKAFNKPDFYDKNYSNFIKRTSYFISDEFISLLKKKESILSVEVGLSLMAKIVETLDLSIKTLKSSIEYEEKDKIEKFLDMLKLYFQFLKKWSEYYLDVVKIPEGKIGLPVEKRLNAIENILQKKIEEFSGDTLTNSLSFSVEQTVIGRKGRFSMFEPKTLEDVFTFIHQSLINIVSAISKQIYPKISLPDFVEIVRSQIENFTYFLLPTKTRTKTDFFGYQFVNNDIILAYNLPLRTHSSILKLIYSKAKSTAILEFFFYGDNEEGRWQRIGDLIDIVSDLISVRLIKNISGKKGHTVQFKIDKSTSFDVVKQIFEVLKICLDITFDTDHTFLKRGSSGDKFLLKLSEVFRNKKNIYRSIVKLSLDRPKINWLLSSVLSNKSFYGGVLVKDDLKQLLDRLSSEDSLYTKKTKLFIFRILNDPRLMTKLITEEFGPKYYLVTTSNYEDLLDEKHKKQVDQYFSEKLLDKLKPLI